MRSDTAPEAATAGAPLTPESRSTEFVSVTGGTETTSAEALLVTAYVLMWLAVAFFVFITWRKQNSLDSKLKDLDSRVRAVQPKV
jgi:hypothetical protein